MEDKIVTLDAYYDPMLAEIIRARLEANDIPCFLTDNNTVGTNFLFNQMLGGVKINVFEKDIERCREILAQDEELSLEDEPEIEATNTCPYCHSSNVKYGSATEVKADWFTAFLSFILVGFPFLQARKSWHCFNCYRDFD